MKNYSIWKESKIINKYKCKTISKDLKCDVLIVGGGITGICSYYYLNKCNLNIMLVEQNKVGMGVTANTTGKITYLQGNMYNKINDNSGFDIASLYLNSQKNAVREIVNIINDNNIDCDLVKSNSYVYSNKQNEIEKIKWLYNFLLKNDVSVKYDSNSLVDSKVMVSVNDTYLFNPIKFIYDLIIKCHLDNIYENSSLTKLEKYKDGYLCYVNNYKVYAKKVIIASHYPFFNFPFMFPIKGNLEKSYICSGKKKIKNVSLISYNKPVLSIRNYKDNIIYLGNSCNVSKTINDKSNFNKLKKESNKYNFNISNIWSNIDIITNDNLPYIGKIDNNLMIATGYNTWGMTNGVLSGKILCDIIMNKDNNYINLFDPKRKIKGNLFNISKDIYYNLVGYVSGYKYSSNIKCPHMGCKLIYNEQENVWDCPCHGSRFLSDGKCVSGPSNKNINVN